MTKGCYTCRRRRIICDNGQPTCRKCRDAGKECLGYQKPLVWVKGGVASRGKMMGRSFDDVKPELHSSGDVGAGSVNLGAISDMPVEHSGLLGSWDADFDYGVQPVPGAGGAQDNSVVYADSAAHNAEYLPSPWGLIDPLLKDLSPLSRFYIYHYNQNLVGYLVLYPEIQNPYRDLTSFVGDSPVLAHALTATGALHYALLYHEEFSPAPWSPGRSSTTSLSLQELESAVTNSVSRRPASKVYEHFLAFKQRALGQLSLDIRDPARQNDDRTVAAILVLALVDAIESGGGAWKYHLEGAKNLLKCREYGPQASQAREIVHNTFAIDGCLIIQLMGSTLSRPGTLSKPFYSSSMGPAILKRLEQTSWVGCPAYLLDVIFFVHTQWYQDIDPDHPQPTMTFTPSFQPTPSTPIQSPAGILHHIQAFDPIIWAQEMQSCLYLPDLSARITLANIYKMAVYLYASRVLSRPRSSPSSSSNPTSTSTLPTQSTLPKNHKPTATFLINQLSLIPPTDPHFKCIIWPTFIAGAESTRPAQRPPILHILSALFYVVTSVNVRNAAWVLSLMWRKRDLKRDGGVSSTSTSTFPAEGGNGDGGVVDQGEEEEEGEEEDFDWIQELDDSRVDWLFI